MVFSPPHIKGDRRMKPAYSFNKETYLTATGWRACAKCGRLYYVPFIQWSVEHVCSPFACPRCGGDHVCRVAKLYKPTVRKLERRWRWIEMLPRWRWFVERMARI